jgi:hypothetical protein
VHQISDQTLNVANDVTEWSPTVSDVTEWTDSDVTEWTGSDVTELTGHPEMMPLSMTHSGTWDTTHCIFAKRFPSHFSFVMYGHDTHPVFDVESGTSYGPSPDHFRGTNPWHFCGSFLDGSR